MSAIDFLHAAHPFPPPDVAVDFAPIPISYLNRPTAAAAGVTAALAGGPFGAQLTRVALRAICLNRTVAPLEKYACIMAWGGQRFGNFDLSIGSRTLAPLIQNLLASANNRQIDFSATQAAAALIPGLGISFYTKLLFFLRPVQDAYILDQWTAKSILLLQFPPVIRLMRRSAGYNQAHPGTTQAEYECFCKAVQGLRGSLWPVGLPTTGEQVEMAMFDKSRPDGFWRAFVRINFDHPRAGKLLVNGGESLTQAHDYRCGLLVIRRIDPPRLFVIGIHGSCCHWSSDDCYRLLLARLRELLAQHKLPITLVLPPGPCPQWFTDALKALGITVETSNWSDESASAGVDTDDDEDTETAPVRSACSSEVVSQSTEPTEQPRVAEGERSQQSVFDEKPIIYLEEGPKAFIKIVNVCGDGNDGMICKHKIPHIWLKNKNASPRYLIGEILKAGGSFATEVSYTVAPGGVPNCGVGGSNYAGGVRFDSIAAAVKYLKQYFDVKACKNNRKYNQVWTSKC